MNAKVTFSKKATFSKERTILDAAKDLDIKIKAPCDGKGKCGKCLVKVVEGEVSELSKAEDKLLSSKKIAKGYRLACQTSIKGNAEIVLKE